MAFVSVEFRLSERTACKLLGVERSSYRYEPRPDRNIALREELMKLARHPRAHPLRQRAGVRGQNLRKRLAATGAKTLYIEPALVVGVQATGASSMAGRHDKGAWKGGKQRALPTPPTTARRVD